MALAYDERGNGPAVVLVHGTATARSVWRETVEALGDGVRAIAYDRRAYGDSGAPEPYGGTTVGEQADDLAELIERLGAAPRSSAGTSSARSRASTWRQGTRPSSRERCSSSRRCCGSRQRAPIPSATCARPWPRAASRGRRRRGARLPRGHVGGPGAQGCSGPSARRRRWHRRAPSRPTSPRPRAGPPAGGTCARSRPPLRDRPERPGRQERPGALRPAAGHRGSCSRQRPLRPAEVPTGRRRSSEGSRVEPAMEVARVCGQYLRRP